MLGTCPDTQTQLLFSLDPSPEARTCTERNHFSFRLKYKNLGLHC